MVMVVFTLELKKNTKCSLHYIVLHMNACMISTLRMYVLMYVCMHPVHPSILVLELIVVDGQVIESIP